MKARFVSGFVGRISFAVSAMGLLMATSLLQADPVVLTWDAGGADKNWTTVENWDTEVSPEGNDLEFRNDGKTDEGVVGNVVDSDLEINSLYYRNDPPNWQVTEIAENVTLTITGSRLIDGVNAALSFGWAAEAGQNARTQIFGQGTLIIDSPSGVIDIAGWSLPPTWGYHLLDMSGLATFVANVDAVYVGRNRYNRSFSGHLMLAQSNVITANTLYSGHTGGQGNLSQDNLILLGTTNVLNIDSIYIGANGEASGQAKGGIAFSEEVKSTGNGTVTIQGKNSTPESRQRTLMEIGSTSASSVGVYGVADFTGGTVDAYLSTLTLGKDIRAVVDSTLRMDAGIIDVLEVNMGFNARDGDTVVANATIEVLGGEFTTGSLMMARGAGTLTRNSVLTIDGDGVFTVTGGGIQMANNAGGARNATINLNGGSLTVDGDITKFAAGVNGVINLRGGVLGMDGHNIGGANAITLNAESGTIRDLAQLNAGGDLTKTTDGRLVLEGTNSYTGSTLVQAGELAVDGILANSAVWVSDGAILSGSGVIGSNVSIAGGGFLSPGNSPGTLTLNGDLAFESGAGVYFELGTGGSDSIAFSGNGQVLSSDGLMYWTFLVNGTIELGTDYLLMDWSQATGFDGFEFDLEDLVITNTGWDATFTVDANGLYLNVAAVPEPAVAAALLGVLSLGVILWYRRRN